MVSITSRAEPLVSVLPSDASVSVVNYVPLEWVDNDPSVASFNIYWSDTGPHVYEHVLNCTVTSCVVSNMPVGATWYFSATAVDTNGVESDFSDQYAYTLTSMLDIGFHFDQPAVNISVQSSTDLMSWQNDPARLRSNGLWRVDVDTVPAKFFRGVAQHN